MGPRFCELSVNNKRAGPNEVQAGSLRNDIGCDRILYYHSFGYKLAKDTLGDQLIAADQGPMPISVKKIESSLIDLFNGNDLRVKENCDFIKANQDTLWTGTSIFDTIELYEAILAQDNQKFYDLFVASLRKNRRDPNLVYFLDFLHITIGKIALKRGFELPIDTADCPQCLLQSEVSDYSSVEIKKPIEGLPFLIK